MVRGFHEFSSDLRGKEFGRLEAGGWRLEVQSPLLNKQVITIEQEEFRTFIFFQQLKYLVTVI